MTRSAPWGVVVDTSAVVAVYDREEWAEPLERWMKNVPLRLISAATLVELGLVLGRSVSDVDRTVRDTVLRLDLTVVDVDEEHARAALMAWQTFGRGRHPARLSYGDCFTYAAAAISGLPILCTGEDFRRTDIPVVDLSPAAG